ncbi:MAG TPA: 23S rRNA (adenine(2503)-C(2))-methyltransferase RlmN [candidate division Zixibacteria bacterium]
MVNKINLKDLWTEELEDFLQKLEGKKYQAKQIAKWVFQKGVSDFDLMTDLSKKMRDLLKDKTYVSNLKVLKAQKSKIDQTEKYLFELEDKETIETVLIKEKQRNTLCISTQVGCTLDCAFCATGKMGLKRNLFSGEIIDQIIQVKKLIPPQEKLDNIVMMGMGEPLLNYDNAVKAIRIIASELGPSISAKRITLSTCGIVPQIEKLAKENLKIKLAISLNATTDQIRNNLMPINRKYPLDKLLPAVKSFAQKTKRRITFEYVLIKDVNDSDEDAFRLAKLIQGISCKINLIAYNPIAGVKFEKPDNERIKKFRDILFPRCPAVTMRKSKGEDILAACGQLRGSQ